VLENVDLHVEPGEKVAVIGPSGVGKSVLLRSLNLLEKPDSGRIWIRGREITAKGGDVDGIRRRMGMVYQQFHLFSHLDVLENIILAPTRIQGLSRGEAIRRAKELLALVSLESKLHALPEQLSGGQKQRIAIARCLAMEPEIMLFDEPTSALDPTMAGEVLAAIRALARQGLTMIIVTHEMAFAREVTDRVLYLDEQGIYEQGPPEQIFKHPERERTRAFIRQLKSFHEQIDGRDYDLLNLQSRIAQFCQKYGVDSRRSYVLQLAVEELLGEVIRHCFDPGEPIRVELGVSYGEADHSLSLVLTAAGRAFDPFAGLPSSLLEMDEKALTLGFLMLRRLARSISQSYAEGQNRITIVL